MVKYTEQEKLEAVLMKVCLTDTVPIFLGCDSKLVEQWVKMYQLHGTEGLSELHRC